jgi:hypothetical protein
MRTVLFIFTGFLLLMDDFGLTVVSVSSAESAVGDLGRVALFAFIAREQSCCCCGAATLPVPKNRLEPMTNENTLNPFQQVHKKIQEVRDRARKQQEKAAALREERLRKERLAEEAEDSRFARS